MILKNNIEITNPGSQQFPISEIKPGIYTLRITSPAYAKTIKFVKQF